MDFDVLKRVLAALEARGVRYAIFGAVALNLHGLARSTEDLLVTAITPRMLYRMKRDTVRPQDKAAAAVRQRFKLDE